MAVNCWVSPRAIDGAAGVTAIDTSCIIVTGALTGVAAIGLLSLSPRSVMVTLMEVESPAFPTVVIPR
ncbi:hypothetical protein ES703_93082 [subsurface metagenome]